MVNDTFFILYACCVLTRGYKKSIIADLQRGDIYPISNDMHDFLVKTESKSVSEIKKETSQNFHNHIDLFLTFLITNDLGFYAKETEKERFAAINFSYHSPSTITNAIIDISESSFRNNINMEIAEQLNNLGCQALQIRSYTSIPLSGITYILKVFLDSRIRQLDFLIPFNSEVYNAAKDLFTMNNRLNKLHFHSADKDAVEPMKNNYYVITTTKAITSCMQCGKISPDIFQSNITFYSESLRLNSCLNQKISIDVDGEIKNCPTSDLSFGNIKNVSLTEVARNNTFRQLWSISKDEIDVCKDCEFRHVCTDCRMIITDPKNILSKPLNCSYDPYRGKWN